MNTAERAQKIAQSRACAFAGVTMHFAPPIAIVIPRPFIQGMTNGAMVGVDAMVCAPFIATQEPRLGRHCRMK